jgi:hypothetical protein
MKRNQKRSEWVWQRGSDEQLQRISRKRKRNTGVVLTPPGDENILGASKIKI